MSILQVISGVSPHFGGPAVGALRLNEALNRAGVPALVLSTNYVDDTGAEMSESDQTSLGSSEMQLRTHAPSWPIKGHNSWALLRDIWRMAGSAQVLHLHGQHRVPTVWAYVAARLRRKPYGIQVHGLLEPFQRQKSRRKKAFFDAVVGRQMLQRATYVLFASESEAERAADLVPPSKAFIHPLGADLPTQQVPRLSESNLVKINQVERDGRFCFVGRLASKKQPNLLIEAWASSSAARNGVLIIAGPDGDFSAEELRGLASKLGVESSVAVVGPLRGGEKTWLYKQCAMYVLPSLNENFGITVAEAMLAGCHVITTAAVASSEHLVAAGAGAVLGDPDAVVLARALEEALRSTAVVRDSGTAAAAYAERYLTWDRLARGLAERALDA